jgi:hypothetical protein
VDLPTTHPLPSPDIIPADIVANVYVRNISMSNAENGARIKVFGGSNDTQSVSGGGSGYVNNVTFEDFRNNSESSALVALDAGG